MDNNSAIGLAALIILCTIIIYNKLNSLTMALDFTRANQATTDLNAAVDQVVTFVNTPNVSDQSQLDSVSQAIEDATTKLKAVLPATTA